jgi:hypothetical protein
MENEMVRTCRVEECLKCLVGSPQEKKNLGKPRRRFRNDINKELKGRRR